MRVSTQFLDDSPLGKQVVQFSFNLDDDDKTTGKSLNAGGGTDIRLGTRTAHFHFPVRFAEPHPDLLAISALKIISPYVGSRLVMDKPVSQKAAAAIRKAYPWIRDIHSEPHISPRQTPAEKPAISFSGGADSVAVACLMPGGTPLVMAARTFHPDIGPFETWNKPAGPIGTLGAMPNDERKFLVNTDFPYLSTNGSNCIYPDTYAFTVPAILLADHLDASHVVTGDIIAGLTGNETIFNKRLFPDKARGLFQAAGLDLECPCNGVSEIITSKIVIAAGLERVSSSCEYGDFQNPCMNCIKCLRKSLYIWSLTGQGLSQDQINRFNRSKALRNFLLNTGRGGLSVMPSFKWAFSRTGRHFDGLVGDLQNRAYSIDIPVAWAEKHYAPVYGNRPDFVMKTFEKLLEFCPPMTDLDMQDFARLNWKENYPPLVPAEESRMDRLADAPMAIAIRNKLRRLFGPNFLRRRL